MPRSRILQLVAVAVLLSACTTQAPQTSAHPRPTTGSASPALTPVAGENARTGTSNWRLSSTGPQGALEGFTDRASVLPGQALHLSVSTVARTFHVEAFRAGWYGGRLMRLVWRSGEIAGMRQPAPHLRSPTYTVLTSWQQSTVLPTSGWPPGSYLLRLTDSAGDQRYVPVTVRSPSTVGALVLVNAVTTWQAYNTWGGYSLYHGPGGESDFVHRSRVVSFDRPYTAPGDSDFIGNELPLIALAERLDLPVAYATDVDLDVDPTLLQGARGVVSLGHDEYWSTAMRDQVTKARDRGVNVAFLGANALFRHIRFEPGPVSDGAARVDRWEVNYKRRSGDPDNRTNPKEVTVDWREPPVSRPESSLTGTFYECNPVHADLVVTDPLSWLWRGLARKGMRVPRVVGSEYDRVNPGEPTPAGIEVLTHSPVTCRRTHSFSDSAYYTEPSGAGVFDAGTSLWVAGLGGPGLAQVTSPAGEQLLDAVTARLLTDMAVGPLGHLHASEGNLKGLHEYAGDPVAARSND